MNTYSDNNTNVVESMGAGVSESTGAKNPSSWDPLDDLLLRHLKEIKKMGWKEISQYFDNRTPNACQFRWRRLKSGNLKSNRTALVDVTVFPGKIEIKNANAANAASASSAPRKRSVTPPRAGVAPQGQMAQGQMAQGQMAQGQMALPLPLPVGGYPNQQGQMPAGPMAPGPGPMATPLYGCPQLPEGQMAGPGVNMQTSMPVGVSVPVPVQMPVQLPVQLPMPMPMPVTLPGSMPMQLPLPVPQGPHAHGHAHAHAHAYSHAHSDRENVGFVPKVFVKSRRSSSIIPAVTGTAAQPFGHPLSPQSSAASSLGPDISNALNTTLTSSKSRKNSFTNWSSRRSSVNVALPGSSGPSRRSSMIQMASATPTTATNATTPTATTLSKERRESIIMREYNERKNSIVVAPHEQGGALFPNQYTFADAPSSVGTAAAPPNKHLQQLRSFSNLSACSSSSSSNVEQAIEPLSRTCAWSAEEEQLLRDCRARQMSAVEVSILLPARSKDEIEAKLRECGAPHSPPGRSHSLSPRKPLSVSQLAMQDEEVDPLHSQSSSASSASSSKDVTPASFANDDAVSSTPSSATSVTTQGRGAYGKGAPLGKQAMFHSSLQSRTASNGNAPLPSISSIFQNMV